MKLVTFRAAGSGDRLGALSASGEAVVDLQAAREAAGNPPDAAFASMLALIEAGDPALDHARALAAAPRPESVRDRGAVVLRAPVPQPPQLRDGLCFEEHLRRAFIGARRLQARRQPDPAAALRALEAAGAPRPPEIWYRQPIYYKGNRFSVIGPEEDVIWPGYAEVLDYELEYGVFLKGRGRDVPRDRARERIFGYSVFNDVSARDAQTAEMAGQLGPAKGKDFDTGNVIGPCIVTADEIDPYDLTMTARINGEEWSRGHSGTMHWKFEDVIAHVSQSETLHPGEFIGSGTVGGGCGLELERFLRPGDVMELEVEGIGVLRNRIVRENG